jgi:tetratricopeptide (TPR) repeat protein
MQEAILVARSSTPALRASSPTFGSLLKQLRLDAGLTQEELAERAQISVKGISSLERGVNRAPRKDTLRLLAYALDLSSSDQEALSEAANRTRRLGGATALVWKLSAPQPNGSAAVGDERMSVWTAAAAQDEQWGDQATTRQSHAEASQAYHACIRRWDALGEVAQAAGAREKLGAALMSNARYDEALDVLLSAASIHRAQGDHERLFRTLARIGEAHALRGTPDEGLITLAPVAELKAGAAPPETLASAKIALAWLINCTGRYADALPVAASALELASSTRDTALRMRAALRHGHLLLMLGNLDEGTRSLREVMPVAEQSADLRSLRLACNSLGWIHELRGEQAEDRVHTERAYQAALSLGDPSVIAFMRSNRGGPAFHSGDWVTARADFERGLELSRAIGASWASPWSVLLLGQLDLIQGEYTRGEQRLVEALALAERSGDLQALRWAHSTLAERDLLRGVAEAAHRRLTPLVGRASTHGVDEYVLLPLYAWGAIEMGHFSRATDLLESAITYAGANHLIPTLITALRVRATLRQRQGNFAQAEDDLRQALALSEQVEQPYHVAKVLLTWADVAAREANLSSARERSRAALERLQPLGERLYASVAEQMLA